MKRLAALLTALPLFGAVTFTASKALADSYTSGTPSNIASFNQSSDYYNYFNGWLVMGNQYYMWGGSYCSSYTYKPSATDIELLSDALINKRTVGIYYKTGSYYPCITGIVLFNTTATSSTSAESAPPSPPIK